MVGSAVAALMHATFSEAQLRAWAWRLPFGAALGVVAVGAWMKHGMHDGAQVGAPSRSVTTSSPLHPLRGRIA
jgi:hypothetical protein